MILWLCLVALESRACALLRARGAPNSRGATRLFANDPRVLASDAEVAAGASAFAAAFFGSETATEAVRRDFDDRYGERMGLRRLPSALFGIGEPCAAVAGVELALVDGARVLSSADGEALINARVGALGGRARKQLAGLTPFALLETLLEPAEELRLAPVLSNLGVLPTQRGGGLARALIATVEAWAKAQDATELLLVVDSANEPARKLYASCGFETLWTNASARGLRLSPEDASLEEVTITELAMRRTL